MAKPSWANEDISNLLPKIREDGEGQACEFKEDFPEGNKLAKSVAAFATAGGGLILIGVRNDGKVVGLDEVDADRLYHRAQSIAESVEPPVAHRVSQCYDDGVILVVCVDRDQADAVYYYEGRPYIRVGRSSRPATPDEVKARFAAHPSAEHKKRMEDLAYEQAKSAAELATKRTAAWDELAVKSAEDHHALMSKSRESIQKSNEMVRQAFTPK
jgi:predicted HTH transcriptional regulator